MSKATTVGQSTGITKLLVQAFSKLRHGDRLSHEDLAKVAGFDVWAKSPHLVRSARRIAQRDHGVVLGCEPGAGLVCLDDPERARLPQDAVKRVRKAARRARSVVKAIAVENLDKAQRDALDTSVTQLAAVATFTSPKGERAIARRVEEHKQVDMSKVLDMFAKG